MDRTLVEDYLRRVETLTREGRALRSLLEAFLMRSARGEAIAQVPLVEIVDRIVAVLEQAARSIVQMTDPPAAASADPSPHRFDFVHNRALRPILEQAYVNAQTALDLGHFALSLVTTCGLLEAILTDALEHAGSACHDWTFEARIDAARQAGLIRGGCARLPSIARTYRDLTNAEGELLPGADITLRDARVTRQVLQVVMKDLDPGR